MDRMGNTCPSPTCPALIKRSLCNLVYADGRLPWYLGSNEKESYENSQHSKETNRGSQSCFQVLFGRAVLSCVRNTSDGIDYNSGLVLAILRCGPSEAQMSCLMKRITCIAAQYFHFSCLCLFRFTAQRTRLSFAGWGWIISKGRFDRC